MNRPVLLIIRDGWGLSALEEGNAVLAADTPNIDGYKTRIPGPSWTAPAKPWGCPTATRAPARSAI